MWTPWNTKTGFTFTAFIVVIAFISIGPCSTVIAQEPNPLSGTWKAEKPNGSLVKLVVTGSDTGVTIQPFGSCHPTPCVWGSLPGIVYAANVQSSEAVAFSTQFHPGFANVIVVGNLRGQFLEVELFTEFTDGTSRRNYHSTVRMVK